LASVMMLFHKEPEVKKQGLAMLLAEFAFGWLALHQKAVEWLLKVGKSKELPGRTIVEMMQAAGGMTPAAMLVSLGAFILFAETCLPFRFDLK